MSNTRRPLKTEQSLLLASYSAPTNSYSTTLTANHFQFNTSNQEVQHNNNNNNNNCALNNDLITNHQIKSQKEPFEQHPSITVKTKTKSKRFTFKKSSFLLLNFQTFIKNDDGKLNSLPVYLLLVTLLTSVLNTLLLSFVVKSFQLNDLGFMNGQISWNDEIGSTLFETPTRLLNKSIYTNSVESLPDRALRLEAIDGDYDGNSNHHDQPNSPLFQVKRMALTSTQPTVADHHNERTAAAAAVESNYMTATISSSNLMSSGEPSISSETLEIGAKLLELNLISDDDDDDDEATIDLVNTARQITTEQQQARNLWFNRNQSTSTATVPEQRQQQQRPGKGAVRQLLQFDGLQHSFKLPLEKKLRLNSQTSNSLVVHEKLKSSQLIGSLNENLDLQTRDGNLNCKCETSMKLMSRSADVRVASFEELTLKTPSVLLSAAHLYIPKGIHYLDSSDGDGDDGGNSLTAKKTTAKTTTTSVVDLQAYNLVAVNGILMASA